MQQAKWGRVINVSSLAAMMPPPSSPDYFSLQSGNERHDGVDGEGGGL
jgi:hypothetical protein